MMLLRHALPGSLHLYTTHQTMTSRKRIPPQKAKKIKRKMSCGVIMDLSVRNENKTPPQARLPVGVFADVCCLYVAPGGAVVVPWGCHLRRP